MLWELETGVFVGSSPAIGSDDDERGLLFDI